MRGKTRTETPSMFPKVMATPSLLYGSRHAREDRTRKTEFKPQKLDFLEQEEDVPRKAETKT
jgi:hypothetical protein